MAEADDNVITTTAISSWATPKIYETHRTTHFATARFEGTGDSSADAGRYHNVSLDGPQPPSAEDWLKKEATRLAAPGAPEKTLHAARLLESQMREAFLRRWVDSVWSIGGVRNFLTRGKIWPSQGRRSKK